MSRAVMQQALEALEGLADYRYTERVKQALVALKQALAEPEQAPISLNNGRLTQYPDGSIGVGTPTPQREHITDGSPCWCNPDVFEEDGGNVIVHNYDDNWQQYAKPGETAQQCIERHRAEQDALMKLYATPRKPLTDEELEPLLGALPCYDIGNSDLVNFARAIIAAYEAKQGEQT